MLGLFIIVAATMLVPLVLLMVFLLEKVNKHENYL